MILFFDNDLKTLVPLLSLKNNTQGNQQLKPTTMT